MKSPFDLLALGVERKTLALQIAREAVQHRPITPALLDEFARVDATFIAEQHRLNVEANKPRARSRY